MKKKLGTTFIGCTILLVNKYCATFHHNTATVLECHTTAQLDNRYESSRVPDHSKLSSEEYQI